MAFRIFVHKAAWDLPSFDPFCLTIQAFVRMANAENISFHTEKNPNITSEHEEKLPVLEHNGKIIQTEYIMDYLRSELHCELNEHLTPSEVAETFAFTSMVEDKLFLITVRVPLGSTMLFYWWSFVNYERVGSTVFPVRLPSLLGDIQLFFHQMDINQRLKDFQMTDKIEVHEQAGTIYHCLSTKLGKKKFFFGDKPSSLDAVVYAHLAVQLYAPFEDDGICGQLQQFSNLVDFVERLSANLFNSVPPTKKEEKNDGFLQSVDWKSAFSAAIIGSGMWLYVNNGHFNFFQM